MVTAKPAPELASTYSTNIRSLVCALAVVKGRRKLKQMQKRPHHKTLAGVIEIMKVSNWLTSATPTKTQK
jgi:hypothetical protein